MPSRWSSGSWLTRPWTAGAYDEGLPGSLRGPAPSASTAPSSEVGGERGRGAREHHSPAARDGPAPPTHSSPRAARADADAEEVLAALAGRDLGCESSAPLLEYLLDRGLGLDQAAQWAALPVRPWRPHWHVPVEGDPAAMVALCPRPLARPGLDPRVGRPLLRRPADAERGSPLMSAVIELPVPCGGREHRLLVRIDRLGRVRVAQADHDDKAEAVLEALGGQSTACGTAAGAVRALRTEVPDPADRVAWACAGVRHVGDFRAWRRVGVQSPASAVRWAAALGGPDDVVAWKLCGFPRPELAGRWRKMGLGPGMARRWRQAVWSPNRAEAWLQAGIRDPAGIAGWRLLGVLSPEQREPWTAAGVIFGNEVEIWATLGVRSPDDVRRWIRAGALGAADAAAWRTCRGHPGGPRAHRRLAPHRCGRRQGCRRVGRGGRGAERPGGVEGGRRLERPRARRPAHPWGRGPLGGAVLALGRCARCRHGRAVGPGRRPEPRGPAPVARRGSCHRCCRRGLGVAVVRHRSVRSCGLAGRGLHRTRARAHLREDSRSGGRDPTPAQFNFSVRMHLAAHPTRSGPPYRQPARSPPAPSAGTTRWVGGVDPR